MRKTKVHRVVLLVIDHDDLGPDGVVHEIENVRYPNRCISPDVMRIDTRQVKWSDDHPLNRTDTQEAEFSRLFEEIEGA